MSAEKQAPTEVREKAEDIIRRLETDPSFREEVESNPEEALTGAGLPANAVEDFLRESGELVGRLAVSCGVTCGVSCIKTA